MSEPTLEDYKRWYLEIAPRLTNFGNDLPDGIVARGVDVLQALRGWKERNCDGRVSMLGFNADDWSCFLMCVDEFWERHKAWDIADRIKRNAAQLTPSL